MDRASADTGDRTAATAHAALRTHERLLQEASVAVQALGGRLQTQEDLQRGTATQLREIAAAIQALAAQVTAVNIAIPQAAPASPPPPLPAAPAVPPREPSLASPRPFDGAFAQVRGFLLQCQLIFRHQPSQFFSPAARVAFITSLTVGDALNWAQATLSARPDLFEDYDAFLEEFERVFDHPTAGRDVGAQLMRLQQGSRTAAAYATEFRTLAAASGWNDAGQRSAYRQGLSEAIKDELVRDKPASLDELIALAIDVDERIQERRRERARVQAPPTRHLEPASSSVPFRPNSPPRWERSTPRPPTEEPMQLGRARLTPAEKERRRRLGLCLYCGERGHLRDACPDLPKA